MLDSLDFPSLDSHNIWVATNFQVKAVSPGAATEYAQRWLADLLDRCKAPRGDGFVVSCSAVTFDDVAALALQLLDMEKQGGEVSEIVTRLRAEAALSHKEQAAAAVAHVEAEIKQQNRVTGEAAAGEA